MSGDATLPKREAGFIGLPDVDVPVFRMFPLWALEATLRVKRLTLVSPAKWEDPLELTNVLLFVSDPRPGFQQRSLMENMPPVFAQCWSGSAASESDTLLRAYSRVVKDPVFHRNTCPRDECVRVRSTPRKLLRALEAGTLSSPGSGVDPV